MEAAPRLPMLSFELIACKGNVEFGPKLKPYIANFYNEDPEAYSTEIYNLEALRGSAVHPSNDVQGVQLLKKYYCQLHFLKSRFPMEEGQTCAIQFVWKDPQGGIANGDIRFELMNIMYNIGALHSYLGAQDSRSNPEGMKLACSHFQCAVWAFQTVKEKYHDVVFYISSVELVHFYQQVCLAQAQECILEKSMLDNRKSTIISKVAVQVYDYYRQSLNFLKSANVEICGRSIYKEWVKYLQFKIAYHRCVSLLFQGQQAEELQKMGERVAFYQAACDSLEEARKLVKDFKGQQQKDLLEALTFTHDVVEGKRKAAKNENEFIYHEEVPGINHLQEVKGASLVKGIAFSVNDTEVSGPDIFARLVPMEAHEAASLYSEQKAELLRRVGEQVEIKDQHLAEFMSSMQLDILTKMHQASGIPQEIIDRAASLSAKTSATQDLIESMAKLSSIYHDVESDLNEISILLKEEEENEKNYQEIMGKRPPSIVATDLSREAAKYREAHNRANESNQALSKAMMTNIENLKILQQPLRNLQQKLPSVELPDSNIDQAALQDLEMLNSKVDEMRTQRAMLWAQLREAVHNDDITNALVTKNPNQSLDELFKKELEKHQQLVSLIEQNLAAQENIKKVFVDAYAKAVNTRRYIQDIIQKRSSTIQALISSYDSYDDLLAKANKGIEFYTKLESNVSKLLQRIKSTINVQQEERDQMLSKNMPKDDSSVPTSLNNSNVSTAPKLKDYLDARKKAANLKYDNNLNYGATNYSSITQNYSDTQYWPPGVRPTPVGSEITNDTAVVPSANELSYAYNNQQCNSYQQPQQMNKTNQIANDYPYSSQGQVVQQPTYTDSVNNGLSHRMANLMPKQDNTYPQYSYSSYIPQNYTPVSYSSSSPYYSDANTVINTRAAEVGTPSDASKAFTTTTNYYSTISHTAPNLGQPTMQYADSALNPSNPQASMNYGYANHSSGQLSGYNQSYSGAYSQVSTSQPQSTGYAGYSQPLSSSQQGYTHSVPTNQNVAFNQQQPSTAYSNQQHPATGYSSEQQPATGYSTQQQPAGEYITQQQPATGYVSQQQPATGYSAVQQPITGYSVSQQQSTKYVQPSSADSYTGQQLTPSGQLYYPTGYEPNYTSPLDESSQNYQQSQYAQQYHTQEYATSVRPDIVNFNYATYSSPNSNIYNPSVGYPLSDTPNSAAGSTDVYLQNGTANTYGYSQDGSGYGYGTDQRAVGYNTGEYSIPQSSVHPENSTVQQPAENASKSSSNLDLLSGLDFSLSHAPLVPQPSAVSTQKSEESSKNGSVSQTLKPSSDSKKENSKSKIVNPVKIIPSKPLSNAGVKSLFNQEVERYEKYVETLTSKTLSGPTTLDVKWKEIQDNQELDNQKRIISVARCYPMKNRFADILPYDYSRVELIGTADDYINASHVKELSPFSPHFIVTQSPLPSTYGDFWTMVKEQQVELIFCLLNDSEIGEDVYWPKEKGKNLNILNMILSLQSTVVKTNWVERLISITFPETKETWTVMHLQFTAWPGSLFPTNPEPFVSFVLETITLFQQQKNISHPLLIHCSSGIGRSGLLTLLTVAILDVTNQATSLPDLAVITSKLANFRKNILRDREHLKFAYEGMLCYVKQVVMLDNMKKRLNEIVPNIQEEPKPEVKMEIKEEKPVDPLNSLDPFWASKK